MAKSIAGQLSMFPQTTSEATGSAISSAESWDGPTHFNSPDGQKTEKSGRGLAHASLGVRPASKAAALTSDISGLHGFGSSESVALSALLANRLRDRLGSGGSIEYSQTWKMKVTPAGRRYWAHTASARRISDSAFSGWPTPVSNDDNKSVEAHLAMKARMGGNRTAITSLQVAAQLSGWPTPAHRDGEHCSGQSERTGGRKSNLPDTATLSGWATPSARDWKNGKASDETMNRNARPLNEQAVMLAGWATPRSTDADKAVRSPEGAMREIARKGAQNDLGLTTGLVPLGSPVSTEKRGALNAAFSLWLQGYPPQWMALAPSAASVRYEARGTQSSRK